MKPDEVISTLRSDPAVPVGIAALLLGVGRCRVHQLLTCGRLSPVPVFGATFVSLSSIALRKAKLLQQRRKLKQFSQ